MVLEMRPWLFSQFGALRQRFKDLKGLNSGTKKRHPIYHWHDLDSQSKLRHESKGAFPKLTVLMIQGRHTRSYISYKAICLITSESALLMRSLEYTCQCKTISRYRDKWIAMYTHCHQLKKALTERQSSHRPKQAKKIKTKNPLNCFDRYN